MSGAAPERDGFHHPTSEAEIVALVQRARREGLQLRVRGAAHSVSHAIYADPADGADAGEPPNRVGVQAPPAGPNLNLMLDRHAGWRVRDAARRLVEADAGIHLGLDPSAPAGAGALQRSLLWQLWRERGWTLLDTGGVTHQTVSGFTATGSSGGSLQFSANRNLFGFRFVDGRGELHEVTREDADLDRFHAMCPNLGLLGVVTAVIFECVEAFEIAGSEATTTLAGCPVDLFGDGDGDDARGRPSLERWLRETPFGRLDRWPQRGVERVLTWKAARIEPQPGFEPRTYRRFGDDDPEAAQHLIGILFAIIGNLNDLSAAKPKLEDDFDALSGTLELIGAADLGAAGKLLARALAAAIEVGVDAAITLLEPVAPLLERELPDLYPRLVDLFIPLDADRGGAGRGRPQTFQDWSWHGLPMDNQASDLLIPTEFTEAWIPLGRAREAMVLLRDWFAVPEDDGAALRRAGTYAWELYAAMPERFWLNPSYSDGSDEWRDGALRIDPYWYADNAADPVDTLFAGLWHLLRDAGIPFRLHWGKFQPRRPPGDRTWVDFFAAQYPRWDDFLALRAAHDPDGIFLTDYWRDRFGIWGAPRPVPREH